VVKELDLQIDEASIKEMIERADIKNDGVITEDEFCLIMAKNSPKV
jgi:Ca2+-binding EF-hand superfamily protein